MTPKCGKNKKVAHKVQQSASPMFLPHLDIICDASLRDALQQGFYTYILMANTHT